ncbi:MAG: Methyltransferase type 12 [Acidimicrobiales bacterium]|nr:Methyltransferase type 12 [Acidimicrobiales bacterium]
MPAILRSPCFRSMNRARWLRLPCVTGPERFDSAYYRRFYGRGPVHDRRRIGQLATGITSLMTWWRIPLRRVLDVGAGKGYWREWLSTELPNVGYHGLEVSEHAAVRYGHELADIATWTTRRRFDLTICQSVLQYLDDDGARSAVATLGQVTRGIAMLEVPTVADRADIIDPARTDLDVHWRTGDWYRSLMDDAFVEIGAGLWLSRSCPVPFFELEHSRTS